MDDLALLTLDDVARWFRISKQGVLDLISTRGLPAVRFGAPGSKRKTTRFEREKVASWLRHNTVNQSVLDEPQPSVQEKIPCQSTSAPIPHSGTWRSPTRAACELSALLEQKTGGRRKPWKENGNTKPTSNDCGALNPEGLSRN
ncbi:MAG: helix-turn-helix domain-containing protein [Magnetococcales bacterium]|nr:helix-turn-helix domain-containing protein [Magnetococcales bacterium]